MTADPAAIRYPGPPARLPAAALDMAMYQVPQLHDAQCRCVISFDRLLDAPRLARAVELSAVAAPIVGCRFVPRPWRSRWEPCAHQADLLFSVVHAPNRGPEIDRWLASGVDPLRGPPLAVRLVRSERDTLCIDLDHIAADAGGLLYYVRLLRGVYHDLQRDPCYVPPVAARDARGLGRVLRGAGVPAVLRGLRDFRPAKAEWEFPRKSSDLSGRAFPARAVDATRLARLKAWCRERKCRFSAVLLAAYHRALSRVLNPPAGSVLPLEVTIDLRRYLPKGAAHTVSDLTGACFPTLRHVSGEDFTHTLAAIESALAKTRNGCLGGALAIEALTLLPTFAQTVIAHRILGRYYSGMVSPIFSNLGNIAAGSCDFGGAAALGVDLYGPVTYPPLFVLTTYTFLDQLTINSSICDTAVDPVLVDALLDRFVAELPV